jgi:hypothetical protein
MKNVPGYYPANRHTPTAVLGCGMALLVGMLFVMLLMTLGMMA